MQNDTLKWLDANVECVIAQDFSPHASPLEMGAIYTTFSQVFYGVTMMRQPLVAITSDVRTFENYTWHAAPDQYLMAAYDAAGVIPLIVPSFGEGLDIDAVLD